MTQKRKARHGYVQTAHVKALSFTACVLASIYGQLYEDTTLGSYLQPKYFHTGRPTFLFFYMPKFAQIRHNW